MLLFLASLSVVVLLVLCIAGANVANLLLAQAASRQREMAVRLALGATRGQLMRQVLTETVLLAIGGGVLGVTLALWATSALSAFRLPVPIPLDIAVSLDWRVLLYAFGLSIAAGLVFGLAPAYAAARPLITAALKGEDALARPGRRLTVRNILVIAQISLSLVLLCVTGLFLRSLERAAGMDVGFRSDGLLMLSVDPRVHGYTPEHTVEFLGELRDRAAALPGVTSAVLTDVAPLSMGNRSDSFHAEGIKLQGPIRASTSTWFRPATSRPWASLAYSAVISASKALPRPRSPSSTRHSSTRSFTMRTPSAAASKGLA